jgi:hypothetical protein
VSFDVGAPRFLARLNERGPFVTCCFPRCGRATANFAREGDRACAGRQADGNRSHWRFSVFEQRADGRRLNQGLVPDRSLRAVAKMKGDIDVFDFDPVGRSRLQFAATALYHFLFVPLTLGLSFLLAIMESVYLMTGREIWRDATKFWGKLFGINFAMGLLPA